MSTASAPVGDVIEAHQTPRQNVEEIGVVVVFVGASHMARIVGLWNFLSR
ncbi:hypothetical protein [Mycobacterium riyadhense]|nr:hypothetical protein [Mycobacterium riyadhense]MCV7144975.1 hypothetical protein [Mycobacterium riyadhense]